MEVIDASFRGTGLAKSLSNLMPYGFWLDDVSCGAIEGFLQSLKWQNRDEQREIAKLHGVEAWRTGQGGNTWKDTQTLYWNGAAYPRQSKKYHGLLDRAYDACFEQNIDFQAALGATGNAVLIHSRGKHNPCNTTLTEWEYVYQLYRLRARVQQMLA
jgi:hypothetical protein